MPCTIISVLIVSIFFSLSAQAALTPQSINPRLTSLPLLPRDLPIGTCNKDTPCANAACCSPDNLCGYSPKFCGTGCQHNCDAKASCGQYAPSGQQKCPLNVCCSEFGYCGSTADFCGSKTCSTQWGGCGDPKRPTCSGGTVSKRTIGYYESWSNTRKCQQVSPEDLNVNGFTHMNFAFAFFDPASFEITPMDTDSSLFSRFTGIKSRAAGLQTWISVGGWSFTDPGPTQHAFGTMASTSSNRQKFISGLVKFMTTYGFDGVDLDWEYPGADDRGGNTNDAANYVALVKEMRSAFGTKYGISMTLPTSFWYLQHFDLPGIQDSIDWFNLMTYDLHGTWDAQSKFLGPYIQPHTNISEIDQGLDLLWRAGVTSDKVVMGEAWYGRSFTLKDAKCSTPNGVCQFDPSVNAVAGIDGGGANAGPCSNAAGILDYQEIQDIISKNKLTPSFDKDAAVKWINWDDNQWVSYDDDDTFALKKDFANKRCLGGLMVWAMDQKDQTISNGLGPAPAVTKPQQDNAKQMAQDQQASSISCYTADCGQKCKKGTNEVTQMSGQPGQLSTSSRCPKNQVQTLCCNDGTTMGKCAWRGFRGVGLPCTSGCASGQTEVVKNTNNIDSKHKINQSCNGGMQSYCCDGFKSAPTSADLKKKAADAAKDVGEGVVENEALDLAAKAFCRVAVPALMAPLELLEDVIPIFGEIADLAELAATPAIIEACTKGIEKEGKAEFKVFGKEHTLNMDKPTEPPPKPAAKPKDEDDTGSDMCKRDGDSCVPAQKPTTDNNPPTFSGAVKKAENEDKIPEKKECGGTSYNKDDIINAMNQGFKYFQSPRKAPFRGGGKGAERVSYQQAGSGMYPHTYYGDEVTDPDKTPTVSILDNPKCKAATRKPKPETAGQTKPDDNSPTAPSGQAGDGSEPAGDANWAFSDLGTLIEFPIMASHQVFQDNSGDWHDPSTPGNKPPKNTDAEMDRVLFALGDDGAPVYCGAMTHTGADKRTQFVDCK